MSRLRASGLMLPQLRASAGALAAGSVALLVHGRRLSLWAGLKTLELAFWLPDVDERAQ